ncbi:hypothetical protein AXF42_Ash007735 [Apostasia shenzhenica]|uniref:TF-B3 domain-containing protein n=1 Tax=Apostasia shenzhenica TaxID=1088818 RepID=A0A2I0B569_9ASPA|nr:hypothetical protein AXF42_Ash007735 [Apostasia shenzhenica]
MGWKLVSKKKLWPTDVSARHNRVLLHRDDVRSNILSLLPRWERDAVERGEPVALPIRSASAGKMYRVEFAYWPSTKGYILHGRGWASFHKDVAFEKMKGGVLFLLALCSMIPLTVMMAGRIGGGSLRW